MGIVCVLVRSSTSRHVYMQGMDDLEFYYYIFLVFLNNSAILLF